MKNSLLQKHFALQVSFLLLLLAVGMTKAMAQLANQTKLTDYNYHNLNTIEERVFLLHSIEESDFYSYALSEEEGKIDIFVSDDYQCNDSNANSDFDFFLENLYDEWTVFSNLDKIERGNLFVEWRYQLEDEVFLAINEDFHSQLRSGNSTCYGAIEYVSSDGFFQYPASVNLGNAESGPYYGCLNVPRNPAWFYMQIAEPGNLNIQITANIDIDFACWGPFDNYETACSQLLSDKLIACSFSANHTEHCLINNAQSGQYYILLITNYSNQSGDITFENIGTGSTGCSGSKTVSAVVNPTGNGTVTGGGTYWCGTSCTLTATANEGYVFGYWTNESGAVVSTDAEYTFTVWGNRTFTANFIEESEACYLTLNLYDSGGDGWSRNYLVLNYEDGSYQNLTMPGGATASFSLPIADGSHVSLGWISGTDTDQCSFTISYSNGNVIYYGYNLNNSFDYEFDLDCAGMPLITFDVMTEASPTAGGTVSGAGQYAYYTPCTLNASANAGYVFANWTLNGVIVSTDAEYTFEVIENAVCIANFVTDGNIVFADANVKSICIAHWDTNGDGELSYAEAASVTDLGSYFQNNSNIIMFNELQYFIGLSSIGDNAFKNCSGLTLISLPNTVNTIGNSTFYGCSSMTGLLTLPNNLTTIGSYAFYNCSGLIGGLTIPDSVITIGDYAFQGCSGFMGFLTIGESVTSIGSYAFSGCRNFTGSINIPNSVITIGIYAFYGCTAFWGTLTIGSSVTTIGNSAFNGCTGLVGDVEIPNSVTSIGPFAFYNCHSFGGNLTIGGSVTSIGASAFDNCTGFTGTLTVGNSVASIGYNAFHNCSGFTQVHYNATNCADVLSPYNDYYPPFTGCGGTLTIGDNVERIPNYIFYDASFTGDLTIPSSVTTIGSYAFYNCTELVGEIVIPNSVTTIGSSAFYNCYGFSGTLTIGNSVTTIGESAFYYCINLVGNIEIPNSVTSIGSSAFYNCNKFSGSLTIPSSVTSIGYQAFYNCYRLSEVNYNVTNHADFNDNSGYDYLPFQNCHGHLNIGDNVVRIPSYMFCNADFSGILTIPNSVISISDGAFKNCNLLTGTLVIPNSLNTIGISAFEDCDGLSDIITGNNVMIVGNRAFYSCSNLHSITLPVPVTVIGIEAFRYCTHLTEINMQSPQAPSIGWDVFSDNAQGRIINIPCGTTENYSTGYWEEWANALNEMCDGLEITAVVNPEVAGNVTGAGTYDYSEMCTLIATSNVGYPFINWTRNGVVVSTENTYTFGVTWSGTYVANFTEEPVSYEITAVVNNEEGGIVTGAGDYLYIATATLVATPAEGYSFINWTKDGLVVSTDATYSFVVTEGGDYMANFELNTYEITITANPAQGGSVSEVSGIYDHGTTVTLTATANEGYTFISWTKDGEVLSSDPIFSFVVTEAGAYVANFELNNYEIIAIANPEAGGTVTGAGTYDHFSTCTLVATANIGYHFLNWMLDGTVVTAEPNYSFEVTGAASYVANFELNSYEITAVVNPEAGGTVTGMGTYDHFSTCTLVATPSTGYHFLNWTLDGAVVTDESTYSFEVDGSADFVANFGLNSYEITAAVNPEAGGTVTGTGTYDHFSTCTLVATASTGYHFLNWTLDGTVVTDESTYSFEVDGSANFVANFELNSYEITAIASPEVGGTVEGAGTYDHFSICTLTATANEGYHFVSWNSVTGAPVSTTATFSFTVTEAGNFVAIFEPNIYEITVTANPAEGGTVSQSGNGTYDNGASVTLTATANEGYTFLYWTANGAMLSTNPTYTFTVTGNTDCVARFYSGDANLEIDPFTSGWNWYSTYIEQEGINGLAQLEESLGSGGIQIKSQQQYVNYYEGMGWMGMLDAINNESSYKIKTNSPCVVEMIGTETTPTAHPITIGSGWNWIGYPVNASMSVAEALSSIIPTNGDQLKAQNGYANYYEGMGWMGTLSTITPGMGLLYKSNGSGTFTLVYPTGTKGETLAENITSENNHWVPDMHAYPDNMTVTAVVELEDVELGSDNYELAAFANGECRGSVRLMYVAPIDRHIAFLTVTGEDVEMLTFGLYDTQTGEEIYDAQEILNFSNNATVGDVREPYAIYFRGTVGLDEWANSLQVFPNPVRKGENVSLSLSADEIGKVQVEIINALGQVETIRTTTLQTTIAAPSVAGVYTLRITVEGKGACYRKLVVR